MLKTMLTGAVAALVLALPTGALAANGKPGGQLRERAHHVRTAIARHCGADADQATQQRCAVAAQKAVAKLQQLDARIDAKLADIQSRCGETQECSKRDQRLTDVLTRLKQRVEKLTAWIDAHGQVPASAGDLTGDAPAAPTP